MKINKVMVLAVCVSTCAVQDASAMNLGRGIKAAWNSPKAQGAREKARNVLAKIPGLGRLTPKPATQPDYITAPQPASLAVVPTTITGSDASPVVDSRPRSASQTSKHSSHSQHSASAAQSAADLELTPQREQAALAALQQGLSNVLAINAVVTQEPAAIAIQKLFRGHRARKQAAGKKNLTIYLQRAFRARRAARLAQPVDTAAGVGQQQPQQEPVIEQPVQQQMQAPVAPAANGSVFTLKNAAIAAALAGAYYYRDAIKAWWYKDSKPKVDAVAQELINANVAVEKTEEAQEASEEVAPTKA